MVYVRSIKNINVISRKQRYRSQELKVANNPELGGAGVVSIAKANDEVTVGLRRKKYCDLRVIGKLWRKSCALMVNDDL